MQERCRLARAVMAASVIGVALAGCSSDPEPLCEASSGATVCVVPNKKAYRIEPEGFQAGSELRVSGGDRSPLVVAIAANGKPPPGGVLGLLPTSGPEIVTLEGTSRSGAPVRFVIACGPETTPDGRCTPRIEPTP